jgi:CMP-N-acetylneuraminic acid synthetase
MKPVNHDPMNLIKTQDLNPVYEENSCFYAFTTDYFFRNFKRCGADATLYEIGYPENIDIDGGADWQVADVAMEAFGEALHLRGK